MITVDSELARHVTEVRESRGWSQRELGRRAGVSGAAISKLESGEVESQASTIVKVAHALGEEPQLLLRLAGHLSATPPPTDLDTQVSAAFRSIPDDKLRKAVARVVFALAGDGSAEHAPTVAVPSRSGQGPLTDVQEADVHALWEEIVFEMEYCGLLLLENWTDKAEVERHFLALQQGLLRLFWTLMGQEDRAWVGQYTQRLLNAYRRHREQREGERHEIPTSTDKA